MEEFSSRRLPSSTHGSEIASASHNCQQKGREAMGRLLTRYQPALLAHLGIEFRATEDAAQDLLQSFVAERILENESLAQAQANRPCMCLAPKPRVGKGRGINSAGTPTLQI